MAAAVVTPSSAFADEPSRPLSVEASQGFGPIDDWATAALLATKQPFWEYGPIDDWATAALLATKQPFWGHGRYTNVDFLEEPGVGKVSYSVAPSEAYDEVAYFKLPKVTPAQ
jgi:hypothetical protein